jgi:RNA recognition motif-containing protein
VFVFTLFVSNINFQAEQEDLKAFFEEGGYLAKDIRLVKEAGRSKGFAFLEVADKETGLEAIDNMHGQVFMGRSLNVREAKEQPAFERRRYAGRR